MSIQIGNTSYSIPTQALDGAQGMVQTSASGQPGLGAADLSNINSKQWETLKSKDGIQLSAPRTADGGDTNGLSSKLDAMSQITDIYSVMALFQKMSQDARTVAREQRHAEMQAQMEAMALPPTRCGVRLSSG